MRCIETARCPDANTMPSMCSPDGRHRRGSTSPGSGPCSCATTATSRESRPTTLPCPQSSATIPRSTSSGTIRWDASTISSATRCGCGLRTHSTSGAQAGSMSRRCSATTRHARSATPQASPCRRSRSPRIPAMPVVPRHKPSTLAIAVRGRLPATACSTSRRPGASRCGVPSRHG